MSVNTTPEEETRRKNIVKFLEGLLDESTTTENRSDYDSTSFVKPRINAGVENRKETKRSGRLPSGQKPKTGRCRCKYAKIKFLPETELRAFRSHSDLLKANKNNILKIPFSIHNIKHSDTLVYIYTGIPLVTGFFHFAALFQKSYIKYYLGWIVGQLTMKQQLLMTLMKLRLGFTNIHLAQRFNCSLETVRNTVYSWLFAIYEKLSGSNGHLYRLLSVMGRMILETVTLHIEAPEHPHLPHKIRPEPYRALILFTPGGMLTYVGKLYVWVTDIEDIIEELDFQEFIAPGDIILIDTDIFEGFPNLPDGVTAIGYNGINEDLRHTQEDVIKRLMEYEAIKCIPREISEFPNVVWRVVALLANYNHMMVEL